MRVATQVLNDGPMRLGRGVVAGLGGTVVMTAFQLLIEMPLTGREESFAPADLATKLLPVRAGNRRQRRQLNYVSHFAAGAAWGMARAVAGRAGLRGQPATFAVFAAMWPGDALGVAALGLGEPPWRWTGRDLLIDVTDKFVLAQAVGALYDIMQKRQGPVAA